MAQRENTSNETGVPAESQTQAEARSALLSFYKDQVVSHATILLTVALVTFTSLTTWKQIGLDRWFNVPTVLAAVSLGGWQVCRFLYHGRMAGHVMHIEPMDTQKLWETMKADRTGTFEHSMPTDLQALFWGASNYDLKRHPWWHSFATRKRSKAELWQRRLAFHFLVYLPITVLITWVIWEILTVLDPWIRSVSPSELKFFIAPILGIPLAAWVLLLPRGPSIDRYKEERALFGDLFDVNITGVRTNDRLVLKLYSSQLFFSLLDRLKDPWFVERHRPYVSALVDSLLYELNGCIDALLQDINEALNLGLKKDEVTTGQTLKKLEKSQDDRAKEDFKWIKAMKDDKEHWLHVLREHRNKSAHRDTIEWRIERSIEIAGPIDRSTAKMPGLVGCDKDIISYFRKTLRKVKEHCRKVRERYDKYAPSPALDF